MIVNVEQSSFSGMVFNVSRLVGTKEIIGSMFSKSRFNKFDDLRYEKKIRNIYNPEEQLNADFVLQYYLSCLYSGYPLLLRFPIQPELPETSPMLV